MVLTFSLFDNSYFHIVTITSSTLVVAEILNVYSELNRITVVTVLFTLGTLVFYWIAVYFVSDILDVKTIDVNFGIHIVIIALVCWLPFWALKKYSMITNPDDYQQIMKLVRK